MSESMLLTMNKIKKINQVWFDLKAEQSMEKRLLRAEIDRKITKDLLRFE